jgi:nucleoporin NDC1
MHIGALTTTSSFATWNQVIFPLPLIETFGWYLFSAWWFNEVYIWSSSASAELNWVKPGRLVVYFTAEIDPHF